jgi:transmembrane protein EpsG
MLVQVFLIVLVLIVSSDYDHRENTPVNRHKFMTFVIIVLILQSGLRHLAVGSDTYSYYQEFEHLIRTPWDMLFSNKTIISDTGNLVIKDPGFQVLQKAFCTICPSFRLFLFAVAIFFFVPFCRMAERYLTSFKQIFLFFCIYQALFYDFFSVTGLRQTIATVAMLVGIKFIEEKKWLRFIVVVFIASFIHKSALVILPFYIVGKLPKSMYWLVAAVIAFPIILVTARQFVEILAVISAADQYMQYAESDFETDGAIYFTIFLFVGCVITLIAKHRNPDKVPEILVNAYALGIALAPLTWVDPTLMRVGQYYSLFALVTIPLSIENFGGNRMIRKLLYWMVFAIALAFVIKHNREYAFMWQDMGLGKNY